MQINFCFQLRALHSNKLCVPVDFNESRCSFCEVAFNEILRGYAQWHCEWFLWHFINNSQLIRDPAICNATKWCSQIRHDDTTDDFYFPGCFNSPPPWSAFDVHVRIIFISNFINFNSFLLELHHSRIHQIEDSEVLLTLKQFTMQQLK